MHAWFKFPLLRVCCCYFCPPHLKNSAMPWTQQTFNWGPLIANGSKNNQLLPTTMVKTLVPRSSASAWVLLWVVSMSVHCTVHALWDDWAFLGYAPHITRDAPGGFQRECMHAHESRPHMFVSMYVCGQHATSCTHGMYALKLECTENVQFVPGTPKTTLAPYPCVSMKAFKSSLPAWKSKTKMMQHERSLCTR